MGTIITINPITRISGFLEIQVEVENNKIINAKSSGMLFRGFEKILRERDPLDAIYITERICGICSTAHATASALALEEVLGIKPNDNDQMIRDFIHGCEFIQNHIRQFYQFTLPDFVSGPRIQPVFNEQNNDFRIPEKLSVELSNHYLDSVEYSRHAHEMVATLGGKAPHNHGIFVGGITADFNNAIWIKLKSLLKSIKEFVVSKMISDAHVIADFYPDYYENGMGYKNLMTFGIFDGYKESGLFYVSPQVMINGDIGTFNPDNITENIHNAWYESASLDRKPTESTIDENANKQEGYSWIKAPRYNGNPMEVGPLARMWFSGNYKNGISTMDRIMARTLEVFKIINILEEILDRVKFYKSQQNTYQFMTDTSGKGLTDTTRGALGHWVSVKNSKIANYEIITPSAWNLSPEDSKGNKGVVEKALIGTQINDIKNPVEIGRIVRAFDPCVSCATHVISDKYSPISIRVI